MGVMEVPVCLFRRLNDKAVPFRNRESVAVIVTEAVSDLPMTRLVNQPGKTEIFFGNPILINATPGYPSPVADPIWTAPH